MIDVLQAIRHALTDDALFAKAMQIAAKLQIDAYLGNHDRKPGLRGSDAGRCSRELWADINGRLDIAEDPEALLRMQDGTSSGARRAALFKIGFEDLNPGYNVTCEKQVEVEGFSGHIDAYVERVKTTGPERDEWEMEPVACVEFKSTAVMGAPRPPEQPNKQKNVDGIYETREFQIYQTVRYAREKNTPLAIVVTSSPGGMRQDDYPVRVGLEDGVEIYWTLKTEVDFERLSTALGDVMPDPDPQQIWRCASCRFSGCERNANPSREVSLV